MPGKPSRSRSATTSGVIRPRSSAITGSGPSSASAASKTAAPGPGSHRPERASGAPFGIAQNSAKPRKWSIAGQVEERERPAQALDPPAVAVARRGVPVEERVAPVLAERAELVGRRAGDEPGQEELGVRALVDAALRDVDRHVADQADAPLGRVGAQRRPLAVEADLVVDAAARRRPVLDPEGVRAPEGGPLAVRRRARPGRRGSRSRPRRPTRRRTASRPRRAARAAAPATSSGRLRRASRRTRTRRRRACRSGARSGAARPRWIVEASSPV